MPLPNHDALIAEGYRENIKGQCPRNLRLDGKRVEVILANGDKARSSWAAWGRGGCRWTIEESPFDIAYFREAK